MSTNTRSITASIAAHESWARTPNRSARTAPARAALMAKFETEVDPEGVLDPRERAIRAEHLCKAYFQRLALKSAKVRQARKIVAEGEAAEQELSELTGGDAA